MELNELKSYWNQVLDELEATNRIAWLAFFDARLASLEGSVLTLDFSDATKFQEGHDLKKTLPVGSHQFLIDAIKKVHGAEITLSF
ncbi:MAG: hypothetical protein NWQ60_03075 [Candidatus Nanopelagicales bacterium]|jgi:hypothetical protein|nr:hypothetical protein [Candidatus Nanopelagicales bacterium]